MARIAIFYSQDRNGQMYVDEAGTIKQTLHVESSTLQIVIPLRYIEST